VSVKASGGSAIPFLGGSPAGMPRTGGGTRTRTAANKKVITAADAQGLLYTLEANQPKRTVVEIAGRTASARRSRAG
jgi:hypothetical protein